MHKLDNISELDWARLAAYIDSEGCVIIQDCIRKGNGGRPTEGKPYRCFILALSVAPTDPRLPRWCESTFGGHVNYDPREKAGRGHDNYERKPLWSWAPGSKLAGEILKGCLPYFIIKREQAEVAISFRDTFAVCTWRRGKSVDDSIVQTRLDAMNRLKRLKKELPISESEVA